jgi:hypothetical protein
MDCGCRASTSLAAFRIIREPKDNHSLLVTSKTDGTRLHLQCSPRLDFGPRNTPHFTVSTCLLRLLPVLHPSIHLFPQDTFTSSRIHHCLDLEPVPVRNQHISHFPFSY